MVKLSVVVTAYNHEKYIAQCLDSIINQKTSFPFEIILGEDESSDGTREICKEYAKNYPQIIKLFLRSRKDVIFINGKPSGRFNFLECLKECKGEYVALCEGDDFWIDEYKLQKQVDFLDQNQDFEACIANINIIDDNGVEVKDKLMPENRKTVYTHANMPIWAPTLTRVFRNRDFSKLYSEAPGFDTYMMVYQSRFGHVKLLNEIMATYRLHGNSIYSSESYLKKREQHIQSLLACFNVIEAYLMPKFFGLVLKKIIELKRLDKMLYRKYYKVLKNKFIHIKSEIKLQQKISIHLSLIMLKFCGLFNSLDKTIIKFINSTLIIQR